MLLFNLKDSGPDTLDLDIFENIGEGGFFFSALSAKQVRDRLKNRQDVKTIHVTINSKRRDVFEGLSIYEQLRAHPARVEVRIQALAGSIASAIAMSGDDVSIGPAGFFQMHGIKGGAFGDPDFVEDTADMMRKAEHVIAGIYARRSKQPMEKVKAWLSRETYMTADEALANGLVDRIDDATVSNEPSGKANARAFAMFNNATLEGAPAALLEAIRSSHEPAPATEPEPTPAPAEPPAPITPPVEGDPEPTPTPEPQERNPMTEPNNATPSVARALGLPAGSTETDIVAAATRVRELELQILAITGAQLSSEALGSIRGLKASADESAKLREEVSQLRSERDQQNFDALLMRGTSDPKKLSPATAKLYEEEFAAAKEQGRGSEVVSRLKGFIAVAPTIIAERRHAPTNTPGASLVHNGKPYAELKPLERARLKQADPDLYRAMKQDHDEAARAS